MPNQGRGTFSGQSKRNSPPPIGEAKDYSRRESYPGCAHAILRSVSDTITRLRQPGIHHRRGSTMGGIMDGKSGSVIAAGIAVLTLAGTGCGYDRGSSLTGPGYGDSEAMAGPATSAVSGAEGRSLSLIHI